MLGTWKVLRKLQLMLLLSSIAVILKIFSEPRQSDDGIHRANRQMVCAGWGGKSVQAGCQGPQAEPSRGSGGIMSQSHR